jgi:site-specific recombinase XerD
MVIADLNDHILREYDEDLKRHHLKLITRKANIQQLGIYLRWLERQEQLTVGTFQRLFPNYRADVVKGQQAELPELALRFLEVFGASNKKNTVCGYRSGLRGFYKLHQIRTKNSYDICRNDVEDFMVALKDQGIEVNTRFHKLLILRRYLDWLYDHKKLKTDPEKLVKKSDLPKRTERLPRPYPVEIDMEIQRRLETLGDMDSLGVLLMRRCGLRVGELRNLTIDCITSDLNSNWFLKVPLGKMNTERIMPLDPKTVEIVQRIQSIHAERKANSGMGQYLISNPTGRRRSQPHFSCVLQETVKGLAITGDVHLHRLRHSFATSLLSAGLPITTLKKLLGHRDIRMTLNYAAVTQETIRNEYFEALTKTHAKYEVAAFPLRVPNLRDGMNRGFYDAQKYAKKIVRDRPDINPLKFQRLLQRMMMLRHELSTILKDPNL